MVRQIAIRETPTLTVVNGKGATNIKQSKICKDPEISQGYLDQ